VLESARFKNPLITPPDIIHFQHHRFAACSHVLSHESSLAFVSLLRSDTVAVELAVVVLLGENMSLSVTGGELVRCLANVTGVRGDEDPLKNEREESVPMSLIRR
jgi:hypothetical protein